MDRQEIRNWLKQDDPRQLKKLWRQADALRREHVGDDVFLRGLIELSNCCTRLCGYCGIRADNQTVRRYRLTEQEVLDCAARAVRFGYGTLVLQAGEDPGIHAEWLACTIHRIKAEWDLAITLSLGERTDEELSLWREAGADRYLLRFETSNAHLFERIHPSIPGKTSDRIAILRTLRSLDYEVGSGVMIGIPGQTYDDLADDLKLFAELDLDMVGVGPYLPHPATPLGREPEKYLADPGQQVPNNEDMTYKVIALTRLQCPKANIPTTTALATINKFNGREIGLTRGANVVMPNVTPACYQEMYEIYPAKDQCQEDAASYHRLITESILAMGRRVGIGRGDSPNRRRASSIAP